MDMNLQTCQPNEIWIGKNTENAQLGQLFYLQPSSFEN